VKLPNLYIMSFEISDNINVEVNVICMFINTKAAILLALSFE